MAAEQTANGQSAPPADRRILILYGSETGNSQDAAEDLERLAERLHFKTRVCEMNDIEINTLIRYPLAIFVTSTTGQGEVPKNAQKFWKSLLRKRLPPGCLSQVAFTTFGLGDSSYTKYNWAARKLHKRLEQLGATELYPRGEADERHEEGIDGTYLPWSLSLRAHLLSEYPLPEGVSPIPPDVHLPPKFTIRLVPTMDREGVSNLDPLIQNSNVGQPALGNDKDARPPTDADRKPMIDGKAALFSHVDAVNPELDEIELIRERARPGNLAPIARLSEHTAQKMDGGLNILDRPNVLRDHPAKYSLQDSTPTYEKPPPPDLLPIPDSWMATVIRNERVTPLNHWQDVRLLELIVSPRINPVTKKVHHSCFYKPGDCVVIYPKNFPVDVQALIDRMEWNEVADKPFKHYSERDDGISIEHAPKRCYPLKNTTLRQLLTHNYDITAIPHRVFFDHIKFFTDDTMHKDRLTEFADPAYTDEFYDYTSRPRRSILEILQEFSSVKIPHQWVPTIFPIMRGREYSIASGGRLIKDQDDPDYTRIEILVALVKYKTVLRKIRKGICSRYIESLQPDTPVQVGLEEHQGPPIHSHDFSRLPVLAIAPGTGVAPIRSYIWDRALESQRGREFLFFGGRNHDADFFFKKEWEQLGVDVITAFSRDQKEKLYVQDVIRREAKLVCELVQQNAIILLCGSAGKMPSAVRLALRDALVIGGMARDRDEATQILSRCWSWEEVW
ncbi:uncharacterized protein BCR38DRAFT_431779 [Pseudomassariella vexata]|uniref:NADPH-dependent diflavin oxidoreductase 1 n=1 Tax=Pseudomassariella vexata TaxID=1141098 RepID=A0A1Y2E0K5_9PEZI|nr:uncharacterized protein BCR38DRAFT_431779 [Pseudomassariella vexata]ORY65070.1 hypothetical protein BCR38DRAFT_431779 [Pseudomassariella vexata]